MIATRRRGYSPFRSYNVGHERHLGNLVDQGLGGRVLIHKSCIGDSCGSGHLASPRTINFYRKLGAVDFFRLHYDIISLTRTKISCVEIVISHELPVPIYQGESIVRSFLSFAFY